MKALFVELPPFERYRVDYLSGDEFKDLQQELLENPRKGDTISDSGGLRKVRWRDSTRNKGKRGGTRIIYYYYEQGLQFWLFLIYDKDWMENLTREQKKQFKNLLNDEIKARQPKRKSEICLLNFQKVWRP